MSLKKSITLMVIILCWLNPSFSQTISGIINLYTEVTAVSAADITCVSVAGYAVGDRVVIMQMKGATIDVTATPSFGDILAYNSAGYYEFGTIVSISGLIITVENPLCRIYDPASAVQLIRVPVYDNVTINGVIQAAEWNGITGGVVALEVTNTLTFNADINVNGQGFRGGTHCTSFFSCGVASYYSNYAGVVSCLGGKKGEGIAVVTPSIAGSRGKSANGGGGSNAGQHGGAGGSNFGAGGQSGFEWTGCFPYDDIWAIPGVMLDYSEDRAFLGGGGGGGHQDNGLEVTDGSDGGGIVLISAATINGMGFAINANGNDVTDVTDSEGAGGAGAGGSVILRVSNYSSDLYINTKGGFGGSIESTVWAGTCHGPGGGGGGGYFGLILPVVPANVFLDNAGGAPGIITSPGAFCDGTPHGAEGGDDGGVVPNISEALVYPVVDLGNDTSVCVYLDPFILDAGAGFDYLWNDGTTNQTLEILVDGVYFVEVSNAFGCVDYDTITIIVNAAPPLNLADTVQFCSGESFIYDAGAGASSYLWQNGSTSQTYEAFSEGIYWVTISNAIGCTTTDSSIILTPWELPNINLGIDSIICLEDEITLDATFINATYLWEDGSTDAIRLITLPGTYVVEVTSEFNCTSTDEITFNPGCGHDIFVPNAFSPNEDGVNDFFNIIPFNTILSIDVKIYSRWGQLMFNSNNINIGWDGNTKSKPAEIGTYLTIITYQVETFDGPVAYTLNGTVTLLR